MYHTLAVNGLKRSNSKDPASGGYNFTSILKAWRIPFDFLFILVC